MDNVPHEILYIVCSLLHVNDILSFRLVNKVFAHIGAAYMLREVTCYMYQEDLARLEAISEHPIFSKHVRSLVYFTLTLKVPIVSRGDFVQKNVDVLEKVLPRFPNLEALTMTSRILANSLVMQSADQPVTGLLLDALLRANAHSRGSLTSLRAVCVHWTFFNRSEQELARMFQPLSNLTLIEISITLGFDGDMGYCAESLCKFKRVLAKGAVRNILKSIQQLESLYIENRNLGFGGTGVGVSPSDVIQPGFCWPKLKALGLSGVKGDRTEIMNILLLHKATLQTLRLRDIHLTSTSWRKLLPDIRKNLCLEEACICGYIWGAFENEADTQDSWNHPLGIQDTEYWDLSEPEDGSHDMRESINVYCRQGGENYPDELPLSELVVNKYYHQYVQPFFQNNDDDDDDEDFELDAEEEENNG
ncbi:hypothetical protein E0Z10_g700 [Xylaria hypoxylon]|uniref:F-box domain-containing protein n=1 Tax=Xylaria hypoxylon TaxID=37992 RepID=A0A4Z0Z7A4_9PEZI|nr:hypothetical protein E0Z10_g700 [Xylaria hypoxylon]